MDSTSDVARIIHVCQMQGLYEFEKAPGKVHPGNTCSMQNNLGTKGIFVLQYNVHDSRHAWMFNNNSILFLKMGIMS